VERWKEQQNIPLGRVTNIVYMGMGEPLDNLKNVMESASIFCDPQAFFLSHNIVTVSTVGLLPALNKVLIDTPICVALSLHSPFEEERSRMMPVNSKHSLTAILACLNQHLKSGVRKSFLIQYTLIRGINDSLAHAKALIELLSSGNFKINLIPLNEHEGTSFRRPDLGKVYEFQQALKKGGLVATIRLSKGRDIEAACGQLIQERLKGISHEK
jgi:23S rRNA (adenine2503-C2)-methyltransferase